MSEFPAILYKCPGIWPGNGYSFSTRPANDREEFDAAVSDGWHPTVPLAVEAWRKPVQAPIPTQPAPVIADDAPPTRGEIEEMARKLGIAVHHKHSDATLLKKIEDAMKEPAGDVDKT